jgi:hypothetical protein
MNVIFKANSEFVVDEHWLIKLPTLIKNGLCLMYAGRVKWYVVVSHQRIVEISKIGGKVFKIFALTFVCL